VDAQPEMLARLREKLSGSSGNIELREGHAEHTGLPAGSCDCVLLANTWHEIEDQPAALREAERILRFGGTLALLDWPPLADIGRYVRVRVYDPSSRAKYLAGEEVRTERIVAPDQ
jgi:ubiquinone/menaquinone biosynthesis C-methylase UbiE